MCAAMPASVFHQCPVCLTPRESPALPGQCAACGFALDAHSAVWRTRTRTTDVAVRYALAGVIVGILMALVYPTGTQRAAYAITPLVLGLAAAAGGLTLRRLFSGHIQDRFVALTPAGIVVGTRTPPLLIPWERFDRIVVRRGFLRIEQVGDQPLHTLDDIFASAAEAEVFRQAVTAAVRRYARTTASA